MAKRTAIIRSTASSLAPLGAGVLIGLSIITPVFAATGDGFADWHIMLMIGSVILLVAGVILKARQTRRRRSLQGVDAAPDMRRNLLTDTYVDHPMPFGVTPRRQSPLEG
jgi:hypothetical protein